MKKKEKEKSSKLRYFKDLPDNEFSSVQLKMVWYCNDGSLPSCSLQFVKSISNLKHIDVKPNGTALFEVDLDLVDPSSRIFIYKVR